MDLHDLDILINYGEDSKTERKRSLNLTTPWLKAEFVKDMMALVNAHERRTAYMLIGIDNDGNKHDIKAEAPDDAQLQQLVNSLVEPPIVFAFRTIEIENTTVGIIAIPYSGDRFHVVKKDFYENAKPLLQRGETWIRRGSSKERPTAWDYKLLKEDFAQQREVPKIELLFSNSKDEVSIAADWAEPLPPTVNSTFAYTRSVYAYNPPPPPGTILLRFEVGNSGTTEAKNIVVFISLPDGCTIIESQSLLTAIRNVSWKTYADNKGISIQGDSLIHGLIHRSEYVRVKVPDAGRTYDFKWTAHAGNMPNHTEGVLRVYISDKNSLVANPLDRDASDDI